VPERAGASAGISETAAEFGGALGIAVFGSIGVAIYRGVLAGAVPAGVPIAAAEAARDTLAEATKVASDLPAGVGLALVEVARGAFPQGLHVTAVISVVGSIALAVLVLTLLRHVPTPVKPKTTGTWNPKGPAWLLPRSPDNRGTQGHRRIEVRQPFELPISRAGVSLGVEVVVRPG
jgi:hypothetical protein